jgi:hypothetical protein
MVPNVAQNLNKLLTNIESAKSKIAQKEQLLKDLAELNQGLGAMRIEEDINIVE